MSFTCSSPLCKNGNCEGCQNGKLWCDDPRCSPYCTGCELKKDHDKIASIVIWITIIALGMIFIILLIAYGPRFVEYRSNGKTLSHDTNGDWLED